MTEAKLINYFLSPSDFITKSLCEWGIPNSKIIKVPFGVDAQLFQPVTSKPKKPIRFAFTGKLCARKGIPQLLRVWKRLGLKEAELHLYGIVAPEVQAKLGDVAGVHTYGFIDIINELPKSHVFVFPSSLEGSSKSVFEALACGLPVITTPNSGSVVRNGQEGFIVEPEDEEALGDAIKTLYQNHRLRAEMSVNARCQAEKFTWDVYADRIWSIYRSFTSL
jgi:glycosyltransferase involved in cell wall biosynthesis